MDFDKLHEEIKGYTQETQPGSEKDMNPKPIVEDDNYQGSGKLKGKTALITGGDSGIGRAVAILFAKEGADVAIGYLNEHIDAEDTVNRLKEIGVKAKSYAHDLRNVDESRTLIDKVINDFGGLNILVNNGGVQYPNTVFEEIPPEQIRRTFETNIFGMMWLSQAALPHLSDNDVIINTTSITAYNGSPHLIDYSATKGAIVSFTRALAASLVDRNIYVNAVAPGPIYTPLIPSTFDAEKVEKHGGDTPMGRIGQPVEVAPSYLFLAEGSNSYMTGQVLHVNGGDYTTS
jgi:NAD(P)-dependent dehydrogenase (short-subunit alcohol dehydrogenase family)